MIKRTSDVAKYCGKKKVTYALETYADYSANIRKQLSGLL
jgi:hypothetical protein